MSGTVFALSDEQQALLDETRALARRALLPLCGAADEGEVNRPLLAALGESGLLGRLFPEAAWRADAATRAAGRRGVSAMTLCLMRQGLASVATEAETALALQGLGAYPILQSGSAALVERWIPGVAAGRLCAGFALTEPGSGSDPAALVTRAERVDGGWRLEGRKIFISNAPHADVYTVFARTTEGAGSKGVSAFVVPGDAEGLAGESIPMLGEHPIGRLDFDGVFVPDADLLGEVDQGFKVAMRTLELFRPSVGAFAVGMCEAALTLAVAHAGEREAFGHKLREFQGVSFQLADMAVRTEAARLLVYKAASLFDAGVGRNARAAAMAKLYATETAQFVVDAAIQVFGGRALEKGHLLEHLYRHVRAPRIYEGTSEIQREILAREMYRGE
ncbi:MAG: acyl-CoA dehydrogenase family protein [Planctomycetota bacterium]